MVDQLFAEHDAVVAVLCRFIRTRQLDPVQSALARKTGPSVPTSASLGPLGIGLAHDRRQQGVEAQILVVVEVLIPQRQAVDPLRDQVSDAVLDAGLVPVIIETPCQPVEDSRALLDRPQQQRPAIRGDVTAVEICSDFPSTWTLEDERPALTLCSHLTVRVRVSDVLLNTLMHATAVD